MRDDLLWSKTDNLECFLWHWNGLHRLYWGQQTQLISLCVLALRMASHIPKAATFFGNAGTHVWPKEHRTSSSTVEPNSSLTSWYYNHTLCTPSDRRKRWILSGLQCLLTLARLAIRRDEHLSMKSPTASHYPSVNGAGVYKKFQSIWRLSNSLRPCAISKRRSILLSFSNLYFLFV